MNVVDFRHRLHRRPEIGLDLPHTQRAVLEAIDGLGLEVSCSTEISSVVAVLRGGNDGPAVLLRGDMDALPVTELADVPYRSEVDGVMHACGHDMHTAMLVGAAHRLAAQRDQLYGDVIFCFQPGEEGHGGARKMLADGLLDAAGSPPIAAYALHVFGDVVGHGVVATRPGPVMGGSDGLTVTVIGTGGHASVPHLAADPIPTASEMVLATQSFVARGCDPFEPVVVTIGSFHAGSQRNVIPRTATLELSIRTFSDASRKSVMKRLRGLYEGIARAHGVEVAIEHTPVHPPTINASRESQFVEATVRDLFGADRFELMAHPLAASEDFSYVLNAVPGAFILLGAAPADAPLPSPSNHSGDVIFADDVLDDGVELLAELAKRRLRA
ncbi:amidohydrolase [Calidifontibacter sp. DB0510]|uniref:Amidohydrolase n=1 Tax=Metallococcus carri TaxID=1656884 RepID=A0A967EHY1_9MICO|nr:M20 family metallopeptidase [Metallococcus carri]NHN57378.1 amidohydrolase [Metallococcus carri]NOP39156.1 amidohydrolase [Calidifontibacter sp. DB2511S]